MPPVSPDSSVEQTWQRLETYRQRYQIDDRLDQVFSLERSVERRKQRSHTLLRRRGDLEREMAEIQSELTAIDSEIDRSMATGALLIEHILEEVVAETGEAWSPFAVRGFRVWRIHDGKVLGNQIHWETPQLSSKCLREIPGEDIPHASWRCGPPACGVYAVKDLDWFPTEVAGCRMDRSIVGVVGLSGKVVEHEHGYRGHTATVVAVSARLGARRLLTDDRDVINSLFEDPKTSVSEFGQQGLPDQEEARRFLENCLEKGRQWT